MKSTRPDKKAERLAYQKRVAELRASATPIPHMYGTGSVSRFGVEETLHGTEPSHGSSLDDETKTVFSIHDKF